MASRTPVLTGPADLRDQRWLDDRVAAIEDGIEAVLDIARNWSDGRNLARLHPGTSAQSYILARVKHPLGRGVVEPLLAESNWSNRQIAEIAGVSRNDVNELAREVPVHRPAETLGADGKLRPAFRPRLDPDPEPYFAERTVTAVVIDKPLEEPPPAAEPQGGRPTRHRITLTEVRGYARVVENNLALLQPDEVVPAAIPVLRDLVPALVAWVQIWTNTETKE